MGEPAGMAFPRPRPADALTRRDSASVPEITPARTGETLAQLSHGSDTARDTHPIALQRRRAAQRGPSLAGRSVDATAKRLDLSTARGSVLRESKDQVDEIGRPAVRLNPSREARRPARIHLGAALGAAPASALVGNEPTSAGRGIEERQRPRTASPNVPRAVRRARRERRPGPFRVQLDRRGAFPLRGAARGFSF